MIFAGSTAFCENLTINLGTEAIDCGKTNFYIEDVIDTRVNKEDIGTARTGMFNSITKVQMENGLDYSFLEYYSNSFQVGNDKLPILINITDFSVEEKMVPFQEKALTEAKFEFYLKRGDKYTKIFIKKLTVEHGSAVDCTKFHEENVRKIAQDMIKSFIDFGFDVSKISPDSKEFTKAELLQMKNGNTGAESSSEKRTLVTGNSFIYKNWKKTRSFTISYETARGGTYLEYRYEKTTGEGQNYTNSFCAGMGYYDVNDSEIKIIYPDNVVRSGKINVEAIPLSFYLYHFEKSGFWKGKWGAGISYYGYTGVIDMFPFDSRYYSSSTGSNFIISFDKVFGVVDAKNGNIFINLKVDYLYPLGKVNFSNYYGSIKTYAFGGPVVGISIGKYW